MKFSYSLYLWLKTVLQWQLISLVTSPSILSNNALSYHCSVAGRSYHTSCIIIVWYNLPEHSLSCVWCHWAGPLLHYTSYNGLPRMPCCLTWWTCYVSCVTDAQTELRTCWQNDDACDHQPCNVKAMSMWCQCNTNAVLMLCQCDFNAKSTHRPFDVHMMSIYP